ncbi:MAG: FKBP-type peptidyl-prolyl cis-trans isomerase [Psychrobium sp.]
MNKILKVSAVAAALLTVAACNQEKKAEPVAKTTPAAVELKTDDEKGAYAIGVSFAKYVNKSLEQASEMGVEADKDLIIKGFSDTVKGNEVLNDEQVQAALMAYDKKMKEVQAAKIVAQEKVFFDEYAKKEGVKSTESGLHYEVVNQGEGEKPTAADSVTVHYTGTLTDGTKFDSSHDRGEPTSFPLGGVIPGWTEGLQLMSPGAVYKFAIPSAMAYGPRANAGIPANSILLFEVELISVDKMTPPSADDAPVGEVKADEHGHIH